MMESSNGMSVSQDGMSNSGLTSSAVSSVSPSSTPVETVSERSFRQSEVNDIVKRAKQDAVENYRKLQVEQPDYAQRKYGDVPQQPQQSQQNNQSYNALNDEKIRQIVSEVTKTQNDARLQEYQQKQQQDTINRIVASYQAKISAGKEKYSDFDKVTGDLEMGSYPFMVETLSDYIENAADVLYELGKDRMKLFTLEQMLTNPNTRQEGLRQAQRFSQSVKERQASSKIRMPNEPLSQMQSSSHRINDDGDLPSVKDLRARFRM